MKKVIFSFLFVLLVFSASANAMTINDGGIIYYAGSQYTNTNVQYETQSFTFTIKSPSNGTYNVTFPASVVFPNDYIQVSAKQFEDMGVPYTSLYQAGNLTIIANATIWIWTSGVHAATITSKAEVDSIAKNVFGFVEPDITDMKDRFDVNITPPVSPPKIIVTPGKHTINIVASFKDFNGAYPATQMGNSDIITTLKTKSGYGIPLTAEIQGFNYVGHPTGNGQTSKLASYRIDSNGASVNIQSTLFSENNPITLIKNSPYQLFRFIPPQNTFGLKLNKFYTTPITQNNDYTISIKGNATVYWVEQENVFYDNTWYDPKTGKSGGSKGYQWENQPEQHGVFDGQTTLNVTIQGSMFDDDTNVTN